MKIDTYIGRDSSKMHLEVGGVTVATEGDLCRDARLRVTYNSNVWNRRMLTHVASLLNYAYALEHPTA